MTRSRWGIDSSRPYKITYYKKEFSFSSVVKFRSFKIKVEKELTKLLKGIKIEDNFINNYLREQIGILIQEKASHEKNI